jgi:hypothetical protein
VVEDLYASDLAYLQDLYNRINVPVPEHVSTVCPQCEHTFTVEVAGLGGFEATPSTTFTRR